jgi:hypothetical protein
MAAHHLTLSEALRSNRLPEFIAQEESAGVKPVNTDELEKAIKALATQPLSENRVAQ